MFAVLETKPLAECQNGFSIVTLRKEQLRLCETVFLADRVFSPILLTAVALDIPLLCINFHQGFRSHSLSKEEITFVSSVLYWCIMVCEVRVNQKVRFDTVTANFSSLFFNVFVRVEQRAWSFLISLWRSKGLEKRHFSQKYLFVSQCRHFAN